MLLFIYFYFYFFLRCPMCFWALQIVLETIFLPIMFLGFKYYLRAIFNYHMFMPSIVLPYLRWLFCFYPWSSLGSLCLQRNLTSPMFQQHFFLFVWFVFSLLYLRQWFMPIWGILSLGFVSDLHPFKDHYHLALLVIYIHLRNFIT